MKNLTNYFKNPLSGILFNVYREIIIGWKHVNELEKLLPPPSKERVGGMDEVKNDNVSFNKKTYIYDLLQKGRVK